MPKNFVRKTFDRCLAHSAARFHHPPRVVLSRRDYFVLQFAGVTPAVECVIKKKGTVGIYHPQGALPKKDVLPKNSSYCPKNPSG
jgi:hypothetical protein